MNEFWWPKNSEIGIFQADCSIPCRYCTVRHGEIGAFYSAHDGTYTLSLFAYQYSTLLSLCSLFNIFTRIKPKDDQN